MFTGILQEITCEIPQGIFQGLIPARKHWEILPDISSVFLSNNAARLCHRFFLKVFQKKNLHLLDLRYQMKFSKNSRLSRVILEIISEKNQNNS